MTREKQRELDKLSTVFITAWDYRDRRTLALMWAAAEYDPDLEDMLYGLAVELDRERLTLPRCEVE